MSHTVELGDMFLYYNDVCSLKPTLRSPRLFQSHITGSPAQYLKDRQAFVKGNETNTKRFK